MRTFLNIAFVLSLTGIFVSCSEPEEVNPEISFSQQIKNFVPDSTIQVLRDMGLEVHEGIQPPNIEGVYHASPNLMLSSSVPNEIYKEGEQFADYRYQFRDQNMEKLTISLDSKGMFVGTNKVISEKTGQGAFLSGYGQEFSAFIILDGYSLKGSDTTWHQSLEVISGTITTDGIENFQMAVLLLDDYGDPHNFLIPINTGRAFHDGDSLASSKNSFREILIESSENSALNVLTQMGNY